MPFMDIYIPGEPKTAKRKIEKYAQKSGVYFGMG